MINPNLDITEILGTDSIAGSRVVINENFNVLKDAIERIDASLSIMSFGTSMITLNGDLSVRKITTSSDTTVGANLDVRGDIAADGDIVTNQDMKCTAVRCVNVAFTTGNGNEQVNLDYQNVVALLQLIQNQN